VDEQISMKPRDSTGKPPRGPDLLRQLREGLDPAALGLKAADRRLPWPTQKELVAALADLLPDDQHISVRWFRDLERLNDFPWPQHLADAYARLLCLSGRDRLTFYAVVGCLPDSTGRGEVTAADRHYLNWSVRDPSYMSNGAWDMCYRNARFRRIVPGLRPGVNVMEYVLINPRGRQVFPGFLEWAKPMLDQLRAALVAAQDDPVLLREVEQLVDHLTRGHPEVAEVWDHQPSIALTPNGEVRYMRLPDPHGQDGLGSPVPVQLYVTNPLGKPLGWRYMHVSLLDEVQDDTYWDSTQPDEELAAYQFWFRGRAPASTA
jgi:hypothetical protein